MARGLSTAGGVKNSVFGANRIQSVQNAVPPSAKKGLMILLMFLEFTKLLEACYKRKLTANLPICRSSATSSDHIIVMMKFSLGSEGL
jgi:hypothetical protein